MLLLYLTLFFVSDCGKTRHSQSHGHKRELAPDELKVKMNFVVRRNAFEALWSEVTGYIELDGTEHGVGRFPDRHHEFSDEKKEIRYHDNFVPAYNTVLFLAKFPALAGVNFFALLSEAERSRYLTQGNATESYIISLLHEHSPADLEQYREELDSTETVESLPEEGFSHSAIEFVNFTQPEFGASNTGAYHTGGVFSAVAVLEYVYKLKTVFDPTHSSRKFSRQYLINCAPTTAQTPPVFPHLVFESLKNTGYIPLEEDLAYSGEPGTCPPADAFPNGLDEAVTVTDYSVSFSKEDGMIDVFKENGPVAVCIFVNEHIFYYQSGHVSECTGGLRCNHFVTLLAYDKDFMTVQNSWGRTWGVAGMMNILRGNCLHSPPENSRYLVTALSLAILQEATTTAAADDEGGYAVLTAHDVLIDGKDYWFTEPIQEGDVLVIETGMLRLENDQYEIKHAHISLFQAGSIVNIPYSLLIDLQHHTVFQMYHFGGGNTPKLVEKLRWESVHRDQGEIEIVFTRTTIETRINEDDLKPFYHQVDIKSLESFEVNGPRGFFKSFRHMRPAGN